MHRTLPHTFNRPHSKPHGIVFIYRKFIITFIHIRSKHIQFHAPALFHEKSDLFNIIHVVGKYRCHIFRRIMCFQIGCLVGNPSITGGMRLVESVTGKGFPIFPYFFQNISWMSVGFTTIQKLRLQLLKQSENLFTHGFSQYIRITFAKARQFLGQ